jgi:hypothetical protein
VTLEGFLAAVAEEVGATTRPATGGGTEFIRAKRTLAYAHGDVAEFWLDPEIAEAAIRTPDTSSSTRGPAWVRLAPAEPKPMDLDRARAWFLSAWRDATAAS